MNDLIVKEVNFNGATLTGIFKEGKIYTPLKKFCEFLGVDFEGQRQRIKRDETLCLGTTAFKIKVVENNIEKLREMLMIEISYLPLWLTGIKSQQCREEIRENLIKFKLEAKDVLSDAFFGKRANNFKPIEVDKKKDWLINRVRTRLDQAEYLENQIAYLFEKLNEIYSKAEIELETKTKQVTSNFFDFKTPSDYDPAKEKLPVLYEVEIEKENLEEMKRLGINKDDALNDIVENKTLENTVKILGQQKLTTKE